MSCDSGMREPCVVSQIFAGDGPVRCPVSRLRALLGLDAHLDSISGQYPPETLSGSFDWDLWPPHRTPLLPSTTTSSSGIGSWPPSFSCLPPSSAPPPPKPEPRSPKPKSQILNPVLRLFRFLSVSLKFPISNLKSLKLWSERLHSPPVECLRSHYPDQETLETSNDRAIKLVSMLSV